MSNDNEPTSDQLCCHCGKVTKDHEFFQRNDARKWWVHFECITTISRQCALDGDDFDRKLNELFPQGLTDAKSCPVPPPQWRAAAIPLPLLAVAEEMLGADWGEEAELRAFERAFAPLARGGAPNQYPSLPPNGDAHTL